MCPQIFLQLTILFAYILTRAVIKNTPKKPRPLWVKHSIIIYYRNIHHIYIIGKLILHSLVQSLISYGLLIYGATLLYGSLTAMLQNKYDKIVFNLFSNSNETIRDIP